MRNVLLLFHIVLRLIDASCFPTRCFVRSLTIWLLVFACGKIAHAEDLPRLQVSDNARYLITENGRPFFWLGDTAWSIIDQSVRTASDDQPSVERYFQIRKQQGFNVVQTHFLTNLVRGPINAPNAYGHFPFVDGDFTRPCVILGPANDYWDHADYVIDLAQQYGMYVAIVAAWSNSLETDEHPMIRTPQVAYAYGRFLGNRYRDQTHIIWLLGGDAFGRPNRTLLSAARRRMTRALAEGITDGTSGDNAFDNHADWTRTLMSYHPPGGGKSSSQFLHDEPWLDFNMIQSTTRFGFRNYETAAADYTRKPPKPTFDGEVAYEYSLPLNKRELRQRPGERITAWDVRRAAYWNVFAGSFGHTYGHRNLIGWVRLDEEPLKHGADQPWFESLDTPGARQMKYLRMLIESRPMPIRIPDQSLITTGLGNGIHHAQATRGADGSYAFVYLPTGKVVTIDLNKLSGKTLMSTWYDPRTGESTLPDTFPRAGPRRFTPPTQGIGQDWILVLDDASRGFSQPGTVQPPVKQPKKIKVFSGESRLLLVNGYSTSFHWWAFLQRKIDRYLQYEGEPDSRIVEVQSVTRGGTPISRWMNADTGERSVAWKQMLIPTIKKEAGRQAVIILAQQSLQGAFGADRKAGIRNANDRERIQRGTDVLERYAKNLLEDGAAAVVIGMHIYKKGMQPGIGNERLALAELMKREIARVDAGPDVWEPTSKQHPLAFDTDRVHPNYIGAEIMAHYWFTTLLEREGLEIPAWSRQEMEEAIEIRPMGIARNRQLFEEKLIEWKIVNRRPGLPQRGEHNPTRPDGRGQGSRTLNRILQRYDKDGDGKLNEEERAAFEKARRERGRSGRSGAARENRSYRSSKLNICRSINLRTFGVLTCHPQ